MLPSEQIDGAASQVHQERLAHSGCRTALLSENALHFEQSSHSDTGKEFHRETMQPRGRREQQRRG